MTRTEEHDIRRKLKILTHAQGTKNVSKTCRYWAFREIPIISGTGLSYTGREWSYRAYPINCVSGYIILHEREKILWLLSKELLTNY